MSTIYRLENIYKTYHVNDNVIHALEDIDLELNEGEIIVILGPSGSGKSTLLNLLSGIDNRTKGKLYYYDDKITHYKEDELIEYR